MNSETLHITSDAHLSQTIAEKPMNKMAIVNLITTDKPRYYVGQERLMKSLVEHSGPDIDCFYFQGEFQVGAPLHKDNPYAFKLYAINKIADLGYRYVLWLDASIAAVKDITPIFDRIRANGIFFEDSGWKVGRWANDESLKIMGITRDEAMCMKMFSSGFVGLDFKGYYGRSQDYFRLWWKYMEAGAFIGSWDDHRHDQTAGSVAGYKLGLEPFYAPVQEFFSYIGPGYNHPNPDSIFHLLGL